MSGTGGRHTADRHTAGHHEVLVVGGGPSGAAAAYWLASAGHDVLLVEKKTFPREKTCGDGLTPRAVRQLHDMGLGERLTDFHRFNGLRALAHGITLELEWPEHPDLPSFGYVVRRRDLDQMVADNAVKAGATVWQDAEATAPILDSGLVRGAIVNGRGARYVVSRTANSRGRAIGTARDRSYPAGWRSAAMARPAPADPWTRAPDAGTTANTLPGCDGSSRRRRHCERRVGPLSTFGTTEA
jgi:2-polyprenyl-6-methoxyphenol hydroxylase-like FAD-dependent oxidoreductase